ncbi:homoserine O-succinyltransferase [Jannaschia sp. Os4]|uniref:homoserine O-succinyltransferase n=1 Tax=Jannaschia sp. Os4 TaxID=2807617 RepID=UPI001939C21C|nr:homoserine O-succinyltransferase [Jannaschia sp. Os4]MBM2576676.1 homoserine O-succinyltransferase [Jannaschia sp. Os4]
MPITLPRSLPAFDVLDREGVMVIGEDGAARQDIRPLRIALLNLMPMKIATETQFARLIGATPLQIDLTLIRMTEHQSRHTAPEHMEAFYQPFQKVRDQRFDGLIVTGSPIEHLDYDEVSYWDEMREVMDWTQTHVHRTFGVCWGGMAMAWHFHRVAKHLLPAKHFGCDRARVEVPDSPWLRGFSDDAMVPVSRWTELRRGELEAKGLRILLESERTGPCLVEDAGHRALYVFNHFEYDTDTLKREYDRDVANGTPVEIPYGYYTDDDPSLPPVNRWRSHGHLLYGNWINEIYQTTPYDTALIGTHSHRMGEGPVPL